MVEIIRKLRGEARENNESPRNSPTSARDEIANSRQHPHANALDPRNQCARNRERPLNRAGQRGFALANVLAD
jgi:hypothetical protein